MITIPRDCPDCVKFRLSYYEKCRIRENFKWVNKKLNQEMVCPLPSNYDNPNTFRVPKYQGGTFTHIDSEKRHGQINWGRLHGYVENLYLKGWRIINI